MSYLFMALYGVLIGIWIADPVKAIGKIVVKIFYNAWKEFKK